MAKTAAVTITPYEKLIATDYKKAVRQALKELGIKQDNPAMSTGTVWSRATTGTAKAIHSPTDGELIAKTRLGDKKVFDEAVNTADKAFKVWRELPAPKRGEVVRQIGDAFRKHKAALGLLVSYEMGKIYQEGLGEVQEIIDICDFAVGLSRQLYGLTLPSERPAHRIQERWQPLGIVGIISAFNFPVAVWSWNAMLAAVCGDSTVWKPSEKTPLCGVAIMSIIAPVLKANGVPEGVFCMVNGGPDVGKAMAEDHRIPLVSATGSTRMGFAVGEAVAKRLGRSLLELGGNNAIIISPNADLNMAIPATIFGAVGTAGQRCTSTRRLIVHESQYNKVRQKLTEVYGQLQNRIGNPLREGILVGPLVDEDAVKMMMGTLEAVQAEGGKVLVGGARAKAKHGEKGSYITPTLVEAKPAMKSVQKETFAPILYLLKYKTLDEAIRIQNDVPQGLSSAIFTTDQREAERFLSEGGSDCGIANVNMGTSGAEIGGAFGGEKETGGGRESGTDAWKVYMRRQTQNINYGTQLPLAQGIKFEV